MLDLLLINPSSGTKIYQKVTASLRGIEPPFWAGLVASFVRERGYSVRILDAEAEGWSIEHTAERICEANPMLVAMIVQGANPSASSTPKMTATGKLLWALRAKAGYNIKIILAGIHPSALPERTLREEATDFVCQGEPFYPILNLLNWLGSGYKGTWYINGLWYFKDGRLLSSPTGKLIEPRQLPPVAWDLLDMTKYRCHNWHALDNLERRSPYGILFTSFGCPYNCNFCNIHTFFGGDRHMRYRNLDSVIAELDLLVNKYGIRKIKIMDEMFALNERRVIDFCDRVIKKGYDIDAWAYARVDSVTKPMLEKMKKAGINWVAYGFESASEIVRRGVRKGFHQDKVRQAIKMTRDAGINIMANFIFGLPDDDMESMQATLNMAKEYNFEYVNFYPCFAFPGSKFYDDAIKNNITLPDTWDEYAPLGHKSLPLPTKYLTSAQVLHFRDKAFQEYFSNPAYWEMIGKKFGSKAQAYIKCMLQEKLERKY